MRVTPHTHVPYDPRIDSSRATPGGVLTSQPNEPLPFPTYDGYFSDDGLIPEGTGGEPARGLAAGANAQRARRLAEVAQRIEAERTETARQIAGLQLPEGFRPEPEHLELVARICAPYQEEIRERAGRATHNEYLAYRVRRIIGDDPQSDPLEALEGKVPEDLIPAEDVEEAGEPFGELLQPSMAGAAEGLIAIVNACLEPIRTEGDRDFKAYVRSLKERYGESRPGITHSPILEPSEQELETVRNTLIFILKGLVDLENGTQFEKLDPLVQKVLGHVHDQYAYRTITNKKLSLEGQRDRIRLGYLYATEHMLKENAEAILYDIPNPKHAALEALRILNLRILNLRGST